MGRFMNLLVALIPSIILISGKAASGDADTATIDVSQIPGYPDNPSDCSTASDGAYCTLSNKCEVGPGQCKAGVCGSQYLMPCQEHPQECKAYQCDPATGQCTVEVVMPDGSPCQDGTCKSGQCQLTQAALEHRRKCPPIADKPCTVCLWSERLQTCIFKNADDGTKCSDGNPCTYDDSCKAGECVGLPKQCNNYYGLFGADGAYKSKYCMTYACNPKTGKCEPEAKEDGTKCDDGRYCTTKDRCKDGQCVGKKRVCGGKGDHPPCVTWQCDAKSNKCMKKVNAGVKCSDGDACTVKDTCNTKGKCKGKPKKCADPGQCQTAKCNSKTGDCEPVNRLDGIPCESANPCTTNDTCISGMCKGTPIECPEIECKIAKCDPTKGCTYTDAPDDDVCKMGGVCEGVEKVCIQLSCKTVVECDPITGCIYADDPTCCLEPPASSGLNNSVGWGNNCTGVPSGSACVAPCAESFVGGYTAICYKGTWNITGECTEPGCTTNCPTNKGRNFVLAYSPSLPIVAPRAQVFLTVASEEAATVNYTLLGSTTTLTLAANEIKSFQVDKNVVQDTPNLAQNLVVYITSDQDITVNAVYWSPQSAEGTWVLPTNALGTSYLVLTHSNISDPYFHIVTTDVPSTDITVTTLVPTGFGPPGTYNITLGPFESYLVYANNTFELSGTSVTGSSPFALFVGNKCGSIPFGCIACDITWEQLPPASTWGTKFLIGTLALTYNPSDPPPTCAVDQRFNVKGDVMRIMASQDNTVLTFNGGTTGPLDGLNNTWQVPTLNTGQLFEFTLPANTSAYITASKPVAVLQMMQGQGARGTSGDPAIAAVPPTNQWANNYYFDLGVSSDGLFETGIITLMYIGTNAQGIQLAFGNGTQIPITWIPASTSDLSNAQVARVQVAPGGYTVRHTDPAETVGAVIGAVSPFTSYAYPAGMVFRT